VRVAYDGSPVALRVKMVSRHSGEASCADGQAQQAMVLCDGSESGS
jgi:hypothetical protein